LSRKKVMVLIGAYWPGHEATGPNMSVRAMCEALGDDFEFLLVGRDRAVGTSVPLADSGKWHDLGFARIQHVEMRGRRATGLRALLDGTPRDLLMLNGFHDREFTIPALVHRRLGGKREPVLLSPRGEFSQGALAISAAAKKLYRQLASRSGLLRGVHLHATSEAEEADLRRAFPRLPVHLVTNFRPISPLPPVRPRGEGEPLRVAFLGRISPVKGTDVALEALAHVTTPVRFEIYGPVEDAAYWARCERLVEALPPHVEVVLRGSIPNAEVATVMAGQDLMFTPSRSENFGHAIFESLAAGTPVLIGEHTPWRGLAAKRAGYDLPLEEPVRLAKAIDAMSLMPDKERAAWRTGARALAEDYVRSSPALPAMRALLHTLTGGAS
jgi:glycosyltransferase involved in cell wall biosynthesis